MQERDGGEGDVVLCNGRATPGNAGCLCATSTHYEGLRQAPATPIRCQKRVNKYTERASAASEQPQRKPKFATDATRLGLNAPLPVLNFVGISSSLKVHSEQMKDYSGNTAHEIPCLVRLSRRDAASLSRLNPLNSASIVAIIFNKRDCPNAFRFISCHICPNADKLRNAPG
jgi:hypothetical protein